MTDTPRPLTRADLPPQFTPETISTLPISVVSQLRHPGNGVLNPIEQAAFNAALRELMSQAARRVTSQIDRAEWGRVRGIARGQDRGLDRGGFQGRNRSREQDVRRLAERINRQRALVEELAPGVDWSALQVSTPPAPPSTTTPDPSLSHSPQPSAADGSQTLAELEDRLSEQVELVQVMSEIADMSKRTFDLEHQRDLQDTRNVFFGFVVSVSVIMAGWAPLVTTKDWGDRLWILGLTLGTVAIAGVVYFLVRLHQKHQDALEAQAQAEDASPS